MAELAFKRPDLVSESETHALPSNDADFLLLYVESLLDVEKLW